MLKLQAGILALGFGLMGGMSQAATVMLSATPAQTQVVADIRRLAAEITVRIEGQRQGGSGFIAGRRGNTYYVLTNAHVVDRSGPYEVLTVDGKRYPVAVGEMRLMPNTDIAVLAFTSDQTYRVVEWGNSDRLQPNQPVVVAGWALSGGSLRQRIFVSTDGVLSQQHQTALSYTNIVRVGMSGGPVLDAQGKAIAVNRLVQLVGNTDQIVGGGVPINLVSAWWKAAGLPISAPPIASAETVVRNNPNLTVARSLTGATGAINSISLATTLLASGNSTGQVTIWDLNQAQPVRRIAAHQQTVNATALSPNQSIVATGSDDRTIKIWDVQSGQLLKTLTGHQDAVSSLAITPDGQRLISGSWDQTVKVWDLATGAVIKTLTGHSGIVNAIAISADGQILASSSRDKTVKLWNLQNFQLIRTLSGSRLSILSVAISPDRKLIAGGSGEGTVYLWETSTGKLKSTLKHHTDGVWTVAFSRDSKTLFSGGWDKTIKVWDLTTTKLKMTLTGHRDYVVTLAVTADGKWLISGSWDKEIKFWSL